MMIVQRIIIIIGIVIVVTVSILGLKYSGYEKDFEETLELDQASINKLTMEINGVSKTTKDKSKINELFEYFNQVDYKRKRGDQTAYMPIKAYIIYLHTDDYSDFIVPYNDEAMISYKVYKIKNGEITYEFLTNYYESLN